MFDFGRDVTEMIVVPRDDIPRDFDFFVRIFEASPKATIFESSNSVEVEIVT